VPAIEQGYPQREVAESAYRFQQAVERRERIIVGVNEFVMENEPRLPILYIDDAVAETQMARLDALRRTRDNDAVARALDALRATAQGQGNTMEPLLDCVRASASVGEMCDALRQVWGEWEEEPVI
jgi:methylmalonyl-CoA mutase, N-terminal domain